MTAENEHKLHGVGYIDFEQSYPPTSKELSSIVDSKVFIDQSDGNEFRGNLAFTVQESGELLYVCPTNPPDRKIYENPSPEPEIVGTPEEIIGNRKWSLVKA